MVQRRAPNNCVYLLREIAALELDRAVALDAGEAEREPARVAGGGLDAVERDLDDELRAYQDGDPAPGGLTGEQLAGLPLQELVREPLEALPDHQKLAGSRVQGPEV